MFKSQKPFMPPTKLMCTMDDFEKIFKDDGTVDMEEVNWFIDEHEKELARYIYLDNMYLGFHSIFTEDDKDPWKPDTRLAVNFPKFLTRSFTGFGYGIPIKVTADDKAISESIAAFEEKNNMHSHEKDLVKICCKKGHAWEYMYQNEDAKTRVKALEPDNTFCVYLDTMTEHALFGIRYGYHANRKSTEIKKRYGEIMTSDTLYQFEEEKVTKTDDNPYGMIPMVEWIFDKERMGLYEDVCGAVELHNHTLCEKGNDVDALAEAYLAILGAEVDKDGVKRIRDERLINFFGTDNPKDVIVQFLSKPTADATQENLLDRLIDIIFMISMVCNFSDENFGSSTSGISLRYKIFNMGNLAKDFDTNIKSSIKKRYKLFCSLGTNSHDQNAFEKIKITFTRNLPANYLEEAQTAQTLSSLVSKETWMKGLSVVDDPKEEIDRLKKEKQEEADDLMNSIMFQNQKEVTADAKASQPDQS